MYVYLCLDMRKFLWMLKLRYHQICYLCTASASCLERYAMINCLNLPRKTDMTKIIFSQLVNGYLHYANKIHGTCYSSYKSFGPISRSYINLSISSKMSIGPHQFSLSIIGFNRCIGSLVYTVFINCLYRMSLKVSSICFQNYQETYKLVVKISFVWAVHLLQFNNNGQQEQLCTEQKLAFCIKSYLLRTII